jgi:NAD(P)-dependent dehydrogenase (short-subunit alcohol dehydrogenase family)
MNRAESVSGKVVVITGGARGIGLATAKVLDLLGAKVAMATSMSKRSNRRARTLGSTCATRST